MIKKSNDSKRFSLVFLFYYQTNIFNINRFLCCVIIIIFEHYKPLLSLECILGKFHVNCHNSIVNNMFYQSIRYRKERRVLLFFATLNLYHKANEEA